MAKKFQKNSKHLVDLINSTSLHAIALLAQVDKFAFLGVLDMTKPEPHARSVIVECISDVKREDITIADQESIRLLQLVRFRTEEMLDRAYKIIELENHPEIDSFDQAADAMTRLIWLRVKASRVFDQIETIYLTHHFHGHKKFLALQSGTAMDVTLNGPRKLKANCMKVLVRFWVSMMRVKKAARSFTLKWMMAMIQPNDGFTIWSFITRAR